MKGLDQKKLELLSHIINNCTAEEIEKLYADFKASQQKEVASSHA
ncbi:hypothetical protein ACWGPW_24385 [Paenibacillus chitinolyticus]